MISALIVDDKPLAIDILVSHMQKLSELELKASFTNPLEALSYLELTTIDLIFLDIQMPELTGIQFMQIVNSSVRIILTTAYPDYALEGFEHNAIDYLVKPISFERFYLAFQKAKQLINNNKEPRPPLQKTISQKDFIFIRTDRRIKKVYYKDIFYAEAKQNYVAFFTATEKLLALQTMKQTEEQLPADLFCRVHKSYIVNISAIGSIEQHLISIQKIQIPIGESYRSIFYKLLGL